MGPILVHDFVTEEERLALSRWIAEQHSLGHVRRPDGQYFRETDGLTDIPDLFWEVRDRITALLGIDDNPCPMFGSFVASVGDKGRTEEHTDNYVAKAWKYRHLRCNLFIQLPIGGGVPFANRKPFTVKERDLVVFTPDLVGHGYSPIEGDRRRVICSYGYMAAPGCRVLGEELTPKV